MRFRLIALVGLSLFLLGGCAAQGGGESPTPSASQTPEENAYHKITAEEAKKMMDEGGVTVVDVRRADEYEEARVPGAVLVPNETIADEAEAALPDQEATLLIYCRSGRRSKAASDTLVGLGYKNIYDFGGIIDWPYDTKSGAQQGS